MVIQYAVGSETLQVILKTSLKAEFRYNELLSKTTNATLADWLEKKRDYTSDFILDVQVLLERMNINPVDLSKIQLKFWGWLTEFKALIAPLNDEGVIRETLDIDNYYLKALSEVKNSVVVTDELYGLYEQQIKAIKLPCNPLINDNTLIR